MSLTHAVCTLFLSLFAASASAQVSSPQRTRIGVGEVLVLFEREQRVGNFGSGPGVRALHIILNGDGRWSDAAIDSVVDRLEHLALASDHHLVRRGAAMNVGYEGLSISQRPRMGAVARVVSVYRRSEDPVVRGILLGRMIDMADRRSAIAFLRQVASQKRTFHEEEEAPLEAVSLLAKMGPEGRAVLRDLLARNLVPDPSARGYIRHMERRGWRAP
jgi:hypothetical protein